MCWSNVCGLNGPVDGPSRWPWVERFVVWVDVWKDSAAAEAKWVWNDAAELQGQACGPR